ncbi:hypothetical protein QM012_002083 [Aureobasidium pullulans]|uniref:Uncharacterized protein n=1 Tax=Aureobasidium pullulans TaxID=5580 RepID=A0ABR0TDD3_AURPU
MSASPSGSTDVDSSDSEAIYTTRAPSSPPFQGPPAASTRSKRSQAQSSTSTGPALLQPKPRCASTRAKRPSTPSIKSSPSSKPVQPWMVQPTKSATHPHHTRAISSVTDSGHTSKSTGLSSDIEVVEILAAAQQSPKSANVSHDESSDSLKPPHPARSISSKIFDKATRHALSCRLSLKVRYQSFLRELDQHALHYGHVTEPPTLETSLPQLLQALTSQKSAQFLNMAEKRRHWETVKDFHDTELEILRILNSVVRSLNASSDLNGSEADIILRQLTTVNTTIQASCTRMSARLTLTSEQNSIFGESDLTHPQFLYFRLASTNNLPSVGERFRLLWAVHPIHGMRCRFHAWNQALSGNNAALKTMLDILPATIAASGTGDNVQTKTRGLKRKAKDENEDENEDQDEDEQ